MPSQFSQETECCDCGAEDPVIYVYASPRYYHAVVPTMFSYVKFNDNTVNWVAGRGAEVTIDLTATVDYNEPGGDVYDEEGSRSWTSSLLYAGNAYSYQRRLEPAFEVDTTTATYNHSGMGNSSYEHTNGAESHPTLGHPAYVSATRSSESTVTATETLTSGQSSVTKTRESSGVSYVVNNVIILI